MRSTYYRAESEDGDGCDDPSEDVLFMMIKRLNTTDNTFVIVQPDVEDPGWFASIGVLDEGGFEVEFRDTAFRARPGAAVGATANTSRPPRSATGCCCRRC